MKYMKIICNPSRLIAAFMARFCTWLPEDTFLKYRYRLLMKRPLDLDNPKTFNEKMQWLKLYNRKSIYTTMADKSLVKDYVAMKIGSEHIIPTLGVWNDFDEIDFSKLPNQFVLKSTNGGGGNGVIICQDKAKLNLSDTKERLEKSMNVSSRNLQGEWVYNDIQPRIIAEKLIKDTDDGDLKDYKFFCFNGKVFCFKVDFGRFIEHHANYYNVKGELLPFGEASYPPDFNHQISMPPNLSQMIALAEKLSEGHPFLRVDFYNINSKIYFGECTFYPNSGFETFVPEEWDEKLGKLIVLPRKEQGDKS